MAKREDVERFKKKINEIADRPEIIPGIHNYCDRWCERCDFVSRCTVGISEFEIDGPERDIQNKEFWEHMSMTFQATFEIIAETADELGIDLAEVNDDYEKPVHHQSTAEKHAKEYGFRLLDWLKINQELLDQKAESFALINEQKVVTFRDAVDVVNWYSLFITVKIHRATLTPYSFDAEEIDNHNKNGSAKIAIISVNRSLKAFSFLYNHLPELEDEILKFLADLSKIQKLLQQAFPDAMNFKRPGFDD